MSENTTGQDDNFVELFVKAGKDGKSYGACPFCQQIFMILLMKADAGTLVFRVTTVNTHKHPPEFRLISNRLPTLVHGREILRDNEEIISYLDEHFPKPDLRYQNRQAEGATLHVFGKFTYFIKQVSHSQNALIAELRRLDEYLRDNEHKYMCSNTFSHLDCLLLPKLQHIRVAAKAYKEFEIPSDLKYLWRYLGRAYQSDIFQKSCPSDQEIVYHWSCKSETPRMDKSRAQQYSTEFTEPRFSWNLPDDVAQDD